MNKLQLSYSLFLAILLAPFCLFSQTDSVVLHLWEKAHQDLKAAGTNRLARDTISPYKLDVHAPQDALRAMRLIRSKAPSWGIDPQRLGMMGFSAGGVPSSIAADAHLLSWLRQMKMYVVHLQSFPCLQYGA